MTGEQHPLSISNLKVFKKMDKKLYFEPEMEVVNLMLESAVLVGSIGEETEADLDPSEGGQDDFPPQP